MSEDSVNAAMEEVASIMRRSHRLRPGAPDDFTIRNQADFRNTLGATTEIFTYLLSGIAAVSLLVGGIGIMNIMLVSVGWSTVIVPSSIVIAFAFSGAVGVLFGPHRRFAPRFSVTEKRCASAVAG